MRVAGLSPSGDFVFGRGKASYITDSEAVAQNVVTRLREFRQDWFANVQSGINWIGLLGSRNTQKQIENAVRTTVLQTQGVASLDDFSLTVNRQSRHATISVTYTDIYSQTITQEIGVTADAA